MANFERINVKTGKGCHISENNGQHAPSIGRKGINRNKTCTSRENGAILIFNDCKLSMSHIYIKNRTNP